MNKIAPEGTIYVCGACGKRSRDKYGNQAIDRGWDVSCAVNALLVDESSLEFDEKTGRVINARVIEDVRDSEAHEETGDV